MSFFISYFVSSTYFSFCSSTYCCYIVAAPPTYYVRALLLPPTKAGLAGICSGGSLSDSVCDKSCSALGFLEVFLLTPPYYYPSIGFLGVSVESGTLVLLIFLSSYGGEVGKFFESVGFSAGGY